MDVCSLISFSINIVLSFLLTPLCNPLIIFSLLLHLKGKYETSNNTLDLKKSYIFDYVSASSFFAYKDISKLCRLIQTPHPLWDKLKTAQVLQRSTLPSNSKRSKYELQVEKDFVFNEQF